MDEATKKAAKKIAKCLALAQSGNAHEAEAALRQAKALMLKYRLTEVDATISAVNERDSSTTAIQIPFYVSGLARTVGDFFGCAVLSCRNGIEKALVRFVGVGIKPELAGYTFEVLQRQLKGDRRRYVASLDGCSRAIKNKRGDLFCMAWLENIRKQVHQFANPADDAIIADYMEREYGMLPLGKSKIKGGFNRSDHAAWYAGQEAAENVSLHRPVQAKSNLLIK